jgi:hypothetical protein
MNWPRITLISSIGSSDTRAFSSDVDTGSR